MWLVCSDVDCFVVCCGDLYCGESVYGVDCCWWPWPVFDAESVVPFVFCWFGGCDCVEWYCFFDDSVSECECEVCVGDGGGEFCELCEDECDDGECGDGDGVWSCVVDEYTKV